MLSGNKMILKKESFLSWHSAHAVIITSLSSWIRTACPLILSRRRQLTLVWAHNFSVRRKIQSARPRRKWLHHTALLTSYEPFIFHIYIYIGNQAALQRYELMCLSSIEGGSSCARAVYMNIHPTASRRHHSMSWGPPVTSPIIFLTIYCTSVKASDPNPVFEVTRDLRQETLSISSYIKTTAHNALASCQYNVFSHKKSVC